MTNPSDLRGADDAATLQIESDHRANAVLEGLPPSEAEPPAGDARSLESIGRGELLRRRFLRNPSAVTGMVIVLLLILAAIFAPMLYQYGPFERDLRNALTGPTQFHWFGVDENGYDVFARTMVGLRISLVIGAGTALLTTLLALLVGTIAGYVSYKGRWGAFVDGALVNLINLFLVIPGLLLLMLFSPVLQQASWLWMIPLLAVFSWMLTARVLRAMTQQLVRTEYVEASRFMGVNPVVTIVRHIIPNIASWIIIDTTLGVSAAILGETGLSFIGFGIQYPNVSLGTVLQGYNISAPWTWIPPAAVLAALVISVNLMGEALRDALDPTSGSSRV
ncbi:ABC transporter permease [Brachybacterium endophyticum]|uniref:Oligopeptide transport system permease protein OppC n=1 Tax=Brachybacterium endophyticum TaxID=2182385 RepID=A0A2U2RPA3_9MICO|nr:ABC transporter permease [Brachybacterium endophyticum]PWH07689.1 ABC transporter permease [Brachybacterium endophyticum]